MYAEHASLRQGQDGLVVRHCWPQPQDEGIGRRQRVAAMRGFLAGAGHDPSDFEVQLKPASWLTGMLGMKNEFLAVTRRSSRRERLYSADAHSPWLAELMLDIEQGVFDK